MTKGEQLRGRKGRGFRREVVTSPEGFLPPPGPLSDQESMKVAKGGLPFRGGGRSEKKEETNERKGAQNPWDPPRDCRCCQNQEDL